MSNAKPGSAQDLADLLGKEMQWSVDHQAQALNPSYLAGFLAGLAQAKAIADQLAALTEAEPPLDPAQEEAVEEIFTRFWAPIVAPGDVLDVAQVKRELADFYICMEEVGKVYAEITMGRFSKPTTEAGHIIDAVEDGIQVAIDEALAGDRAAWAHELEALINKMKGLNNAPGSQAQ